MCLFSSCNNKSWWFNTPKCVSHSHHSSVQAKFPHLSDSGIQAPPSSGLLSIQSSSETAFNPLPSGQMRNKDKERERTCYGQAGMHTASTCCKGGWDLKSPTVHRGDGITEHPGGLQHRAWEGALRRLLPFSQQNRRQGHHQLKVRKD